MFYYFEQMIGTFRMYSSETFIYWTLERVKCAYFTLPNNALQLFDKTMLKIKSHAEKFAVQKRGRVSCGEWGGDEEVARRLCCDV